ncbi:MAG: glycosyl hydrolase, partial [Acidobacteriota bacterium]
MRNTRRVPFVWLAWLVGLACIFAANGTSLAESSPAFDPALYQALEFRSIGPYRGGRVTAVTGVFGDRKTVYMGSTGGGVWKSTDAGLTWVNVSDAALRRGSVGAIAVAPSDANVVYVGTGSACPRGNVSPGDGVYRSRDAGKTWSHVGLEDGGQIGRVRVHPTDPDLVYAAVLGHIFGPNEQRGVFRSNDGGESWDRVLFVDERTGAIDIALDPTNPRVLYAAMWQVERKPWTFTSGGAGSGLFKSSDGGQSWERLTGGLPAAPLGRIGVAVSAADPERVFALVEAEQGGLFRSDDGGETFRRVSADRNLRQRAWYYTHVYADPADSNTVYVLNVGLWRSHDGGEHFELIRAPHGDHHDLWIHPEDPRILINGNDGGANVSINAGESWSTQSNQPTGEFYRVTVDHQFPYRVYGAQQDNTTVSIPSRTSGSSITREHWYAVAGCECGHIAVDPRAPNVTYGGCYGGRIDRYDHATRQRRDISSYPQLAIGQAARDLRYRFQWNAPIRLSPHDPRVLYHCSQYVHRSTDEGTSWKLISPDLSHDDGRKQDFAGGPITRDNTGVEVY